MTITKKQQITFLKKQLSSNKKWALKALIRIYQFQTDNEQTCGETIEENGVGFSGSHSVILSSIANQVIHYNSISNKQLAIVHRIIPHYARQILNISDIEMLNKYIEQELKNNPPPIKNKRKIKTLKQLTFDF